MSEVDQKRKGMHTRNARRRSRELALQGLYQWFLNPVDAGALDAHLRDAPGFNKADMVHYQSLLHGSLKNLQAMAELLTPHIDRAWDELSPVDKSVLVLGARELVEHPDIPYRVVINEAVELTKTFGGTDAHRFVNGVLDKLAQQVREVEVQSSVRD